MKQLSNIKYALAQNVFERNDRPKLGRVEFKNGYVYGTDAHILVKFNLNNYTDHPELLEGKGLAYDQLVLMGKSRKVELNQTDGLIYADGVALQYLEIKDPLEYESVIPKEFNMSYEMLALDSEALARLGKCFIQIRGLKPKLKIEFSHSTNITKAPNRGMRVTNITTDKEFPDMAGLIMPIYLDDLLKG